MLEQAERYHASENQQLVKLDWTENVTDCLFQQGVIKALGVRHERHDIIFFFLGECRESAHGIWQRIEDISNQCRAQLLTVVIKFLSAEKAHTIVRARMLGPMLNDIICVNRTTRLGGRFERHGL